MDTSNFTNRQPGPVVTAAPLSGFPVPQPGLSQDTPRYFSEKLHPATHIEAQNNSDLQRSFSNSSIYCQESQGGQQQEQQDRRQGIVSTAQTGNSTYTYNVSPASKPEVVHSASGASSPYVSFGSSAPSAPSISTASAVTAPSAPSVTQIPSPSSSSSPYSTTLTTCAATKTSQQEPINPTEPLGQMSVALNLPVSLGGQTSLVHQQSDLTRSPSAAQPPSLGQGLQHMLRNPQPPMSQQQHWSLGRSMYSDSTASYNPRSPQSPVVTDGHYSHPEIQTTATSGVEEAYTHTESYGGLGSLSGRFQQDQQQPQPPQPSQQPHPSQPQHQQQQQQHQHQQQQHQPQQPQQHPQHQQPHHLPMTSTATSMAGTMIPTSSHGAMSHTDPMLRQTTSAEPTTGSVLSYPHPSSIGVTMAQQQGYQSKPSPVATLPSQSAFQLYQPPHQPHMGQNSPLGPPDNNPMRLMPPPLPSQGGGGMSALASVGYPAGHGRAYPYPQPVSSGSMGGSVLSNMGNPGGQLTLVPSIGMPYGSAQKPLLYSNTHPLHPHLNPNQFSHHQSMGKGPPSAHERPFKCDQCQQSFNRNHDLKRHKRIHLAVKPFPCNNCDKSFSRKDALKRHRLVKGCGEKPENS